MLNDMAFPGNNRVKNKEENWATTTISSGKYKGCSRGGE